MCNIVFLPQFVYYYMIIRIQKSQILRHKDDLFYDSFSVFKSQNKRVQNGHRDYKRRKKATIQISIVGYDFTGKCKILIQMYTHTNKKHTHTQTKRWKPPPVRVYISIAFYSFYIKLQLNAKYFEQLFFRLLLLIAPADTALVSSTPLLHFHFPKFL